MCIRDRGESEWREFQGKSGEAFECARCEIEVFKEEENSQIEGDSRDEERFLLFGVTAGVSHRERKVVVGGDGSYENEEVGPAADCVESERSTRKP